MTMQKHGSKGMLSGQEGVVQAALVDIDQPATTGNRVHRIVTAIGLGSVIGSAYIAGLFTSQEIESRPVEATKTTFNIDKLFMDQQGVPAIDVPDALARASTVQIKTLCPGDLESDPSSQGTGGIYRTKAGKLAIGTVAHVVTYQPNSGSGKGTACSLVASVDAGEKIIDIPLGQEDFTGVYTEPTLLRAVSDQPALAILAENAAAELESAIERGLLSPLVPNNRATAHSAMIIREQGLPGPMDGFEHPQVTYINIVGAESELLHFNTNRESNVCKGNSGAPVLRIEDGQVTNESFAVVSTAEFIHLEFGGEEKDTVCAQVGKIVSYQVER